MSSDILNKNLSALKKRGFLFAEIEEAVKSLDKNTYRVETAKKGGFTLSILEKGDSARLMHSKYAPLEEAKKQVDRAYNNQTHAILFGFGLGYAAEELVSRMPIIKGPPQLFIIEPDPFVFACAIMLRDLTKLISDSRVAVLAGLELDRVGALWLGALDWGYIDDLAIVEHPPTCVRHKSYYDKLLEKISYLCRRSKGNLATIMLSGNSFYKNQFQNLCRFFVMPGVKRLFSKFSGLPIITVSAGPSLDKNVHLLKEIKGKILILAVDTAFRQLASNGVLPDIVCAADPSYENSLDFVGVENEKDVVLALEPMTHPDIFNSFNGPKMAMSFGGGIHGFYRNLREEVGNVVCWGSISTTVFDLAIKLGGDPIIMIGLDLSFETGKIHARGSYSDDMMYDKAHKFNPIEHQCAEYVCRSGKVQCQLPNGKVLYTDAQMKMYYDWFADRFQSTSAKVINATEGGIVKKHVIEMPLRQAIDEYKHKSTDVKQIIKDALKAPVKADCASLAKRVEDCLKNLDKINAETKRFAAGSDSFIEKYHNTSYMSLRGADAKLFCDILRMHDAFAAEQNIFSWFSSYKAKFSTTHTIEINKLKKSNNSSIEAWLNEMKRFFSAIKDFYNFQKPILTKVLSALRGQTNQNTAGAVKEACYERFVSANF